MPTLVTHGEQLAHGDVVVVQRDMTDKKTKEPYVWRFFAVVLKAGVRMVKVYRLGAPDDAKPEFVLDLCELTTTLHKLEPDEWPPGVHALRMAAILDGNIDI